MSSPTDPLLPVTKSDHQSFSTSLGNGFGFHGVGCTVPTKTGPKKILEDVHGYVKPGDFLAILGPSGSGKTTLLDILSGRPKSGDVVGAVTVNGAPVDSAFHKRSSAYVPQEDIHLPTFTVRETLRYAAQLRLPQSIPHGEKMQRVETLMNDLCLSHVADTRVGGDLIRGVSGGEKRRVSIGVELITSPEIVFLDEPTSGLDSKAALTVVKVLLRLARQGTAVVCTIHQPRSQIFELFDRIMLMAKGRMLYQGPASDAVYSFESLGYTLPAGWNPADWFLDLISTDGEQTTDIPKLTSSGTEQSLTEDQIVQISNSFVESYLKDNPKLQVDTVDMKSAPKSSMFVSDYVNPFYIQFIILLKRNILSSLRNPLLFAQQLVGMLISGLMIGGLFSGVTNNRNEQLTLGISFMADVYSVTCFFSIPTYIQFRTIFDREHRSGSYSSGAYYLSNIVAQLPLAIISTMAYCTSIYYIIDMNEGEGRFWYFILMGLLTYFNYVAINEGVGALISSVDVAIGVAGLVNIMSMMFSGVMVQYPNIPDFFVWGYWSSPLTYSVSGLMLNEFGGTPEGDAYLRGFGLQIWDKWECLYIVVVQMCVFRFITYCALRFKKVKK